MRRTLKLSLCTENVGTGLSSYFPHHVRMCNLAQQHQNPGLYILNSPNLSPKGFCWLSLRDFSCLELWTGHKKNSKKWKCVCCALQRMYYPWRRHKLKQHVLEFKWWERFSNRIKRKQFNFAFLFVRGVPLFFLKFSKASGARFEFGSSKVI